MNRSMDDFPIEILVQIISKLSSYAADYLPLRLVSSNWKDAINCYFKSIKYLVHKYIEEDVDDYDLVTKDTVIVRIPSNCPDLVISYIELFPNLKAVAVNFSKFTKIDQDTLFNYLNNRPTITALELLCSHYIEFQNDVKLENIQNFVFRTEVIPKDAISRFFHEDHELTQLYVNSRLPFEDEISFFKRMPILKSLSQQLELVNDDFSTVDGTDFLIHTKQPGLSFESLECYSFYAYKECLLDYVDNNFVAYCPNLKSIDRSLIGGAEYRITRLNNLRAHTNVEDLAIHCYDSSWKFVLKVLEMFPMVKNLKLQDFRGICHNKIPQALLKLPNLSLLHLKRSDELYTDYYLEQDNRVDCMALKEAYKSKYGRDIRIEKQNRYLICGGFTFVY